jgi:integral membrane sensor domain MASE1
MNNFKKELKLFFTFVVFLGLGLNAIISLIYGCFHAWDESIDQKSTFIYIVFSIIVFNQNKKYFFKVINEQNTQTTETPKTPAPYLKRIK